MSSSWKDLGPGECKCPYKPGRLEEKNSMNGILIRWDMIRSRNVILLGVLKNSQNDRKQRETMLLLLEREQIFWEKLQVFSAG